jgi:hypothetical protein
MQVVMLLRNIIRNIASEKCKVFGDLYSCTLLKLIESPEITILMPQEIRVGTERRWVDMALGSSIVFDFKSSEKEFEEAEEDAKTIYRPLVSKAKYFITTTWLKWRIYRVTEEGLQLIEECDKDKAGKILETQIIPELKELKVPPMPHNVETLYRLDLDELLGNLKKVFNALRENIKPLYEAYKSIMAMLYGGEAEESSFEDLYIRHTYMQMVVSASLAAALDVAEESPEAICSGSFLKSDNVMLDIALPYLNWWRIALYDPSLRGSVEKVCNTLVRRARMVDWSLGAEDVFRMLYEFLIDPRSRREIGEYYTPLWLVELMLSEFDLRERIVLDPFCGSGTFLVKAFYRKVEQGGDPDKAFNEIVGFDVNPLAVAVARAELILAYWRRTGRIPKNPPHIYHVDTLAMWFGGPILTLPPLSGLVSSISSYLQHLINFNQLGEASEILAMLGTLEKDLAYSLRVACSICSRGKGIDTTCLEREIEHYVEANFKDSKNPFIRAFLKQFKELKLANAVANIITSSGGNSVWSTVLVSIYAAILMARFRPDIIVTNPPWIPVTEFKPPYAERIRQYMLNKIKDIVKSRRAVQVLAGADIAAAALGRSVELAKEGVAYVMNREQLFYHKSPMLAGMLATYAILKNALKGKVARVKLYDFDFDVFEHGVYPAIIIVKVEGDVPRAGAQSST